MCTLLFVSCTAAPTATAQPVRYVAIGASDSVGIGASDPATRSWPALLRARLPRGSTYVNLAVSGSTVERSLSEQVPRVSNERIDVITVWLAVNDFNAGLRASAYADALRRLLDSLKPTGARVFVGTVPNLTLVPAYAEMEHTALAARVGAYNDAIRGLATERGAYVTLVDLFSGSDVITRESVVAPDGFHPNDRGYELIAERFAAAMRAAGIALD